MSRCFLSVEYLKDRAQQAMKRISGEVYKTPLIRSNTYGSNLYYKAENFQFSGSFKLRGAFSKLTVLRDSDNLSSTRLITASSGNHGLACSYAAKELGGNLTVVLPETVAPVKLEKINSFGVNVIPVSYTHLTLPTKA